MKIYAVKILDISKEKIDNTCSLIDLDKRCKIEKFINKKDKIRTLIGEILIRTTICEDLSIRNRNITFEKNKYGKPYLKGYHNLQFNISHSGDFVVCAIDDQPIGIDIEKIKCIEYKKIAKSFFSVSEFGYIVKEDLNIQLNKFYEMWTLKESYIKCCGQGLSIPLKSFSIDIDQYENIKVIIDNEHKEHVFKRFDIESGYKMAVCSVNKEISNNIIMIEQNSLINNYPDLN
ncbi:4'-phosphopantetheinyl transferase family protein [Oceanobacillus picturae]|uniref:4'-phosphopantetheinyl transferase family protein n=1 Tax=Oceanobacillus picturae TaxID=171693 RepID=UPI000E6928A3|nr:4'-phosphopantetheinyl transferase superfamily protein [Oceanobacillus picturae]RIU88359.1 4-phosphopantetheinyl transferase [Oceanobacillus picturae]